MKLQYKKKPARRVTIKDLADDLSLSVGAVSQALNPRDNINIKLKPETVARVRAHAQLLRYRPHAGASSIRSKHFCNIGFMSAANTTDSSELTSEFELGLHDAALDYNFRVTLLRVPSARARKQELYSRVFNESHLDALILMNVEDLPGYYEEIFKETEFPIVCLNHKQDYQTVYSDDLVGAQTMTQHLVEQGFKRIAFFLGDQASDNRLPKYSIADRTKGYQQAMKKAGKTAAQPWKLATKGEAATLSWLKNKDRPDAIFCATDAAASQLCRLAYQAGLSIPQDVAIAGYNDDSAARFSWVPLTTMAVPYYQMAYAAFKKIIEQINAETPEPFASLAVEPELKVRASTAQSTPTKTKKKATKRALVHA